MCRVGKKQAMLWEVDVAPGQRAQSSWCDDEQGALQAFEDAANNEGLTCSLFEVIFDLPSTQGELFELLAGERRERVLLRTTHCPDCQVRLDDTAARVCPKCRHAVITLYCVFCMKAVETDLTDPACRACITELGLANTAGLKKAIERA